MEKLNNLEKTLIIGTAIILTFTLYFVLKINHEKVKAENILNKYNDKIEIMVELEREENLWRDKEAVIIEMRKEIETEKNRLNEKIEILRNLENEKQSIEKSIHSKREALVSNSNNEKRPDEFDLDILAKAVAKYETSDCTKGIGTRTNNCFGIKY